MTILSTGNNYYSRKFNNEKVEAIDILHVKPGNRNITLVADLSDPDSLPENKYDCFICTQTLNFIYDFKKAVSGSHKLLKSSISFLQGIAVEEMPQKSLLDVFDKDYQMLIGIKAKKSNLTHSRNSGK